jgi:hypothetical protein
MPIEFSEHAKRQLKLRSISQDLVAQAIKSPQKTLSSFRGRKLRQVQIDDKILEVVTKTEGSKIIVVTAYLLEE